MPEKLHTIKIQKFSVSPLKRTFISVLNCYMLLLKFDPFIKVVEEMFRLIR